MGRITSFSKQVIVFFLVTALIIRPTFAATVGGWAMSNPIAQGASTVYTGTKNIIINGADYVKKGTAKITPPATGVAKVLARGAAGYALSVAVEQLLGAVDWVLDPENSMILYKENTDSLKCGANGENCPLEQYFFKSSAFPNVTVAFKWDFAYATSICKAYIPANNTSQKFLKLDSFYGWDPTSFDCVYDGSGTIRTTWAKVANPSYNPNGTQEKDKKLPLDIVAAQVISNAESETDADKKAGAQVATMAAAADVVEESEKDDTKAPPITQQLEASAQTKPADAAAAEKAGEATGTSKPNAETGATDLSLEFPIFCNWAPSVCEAAQTVISFPTTLADWWNTGKTKAEEWATSISEAWTKVKEEYADKPEENTDTELDIPDLSDESIDTDISFGGSCPAPLSSDINFMGLNKTIEFSFDPVCQIAEFIKPVVISISAFSAALIVAGIRTEDD